MRNLSTKVNRDLLTPGEFNSLNNELENIVTATGGTLDGSEGPDNDLNMLGQAGATYGSAGDFYEDTSTSGNAIVLNRDSGLQSPQSYLDGLKVIFKSTFTNTGATTVNVASLGIKDLTDPDGTTVSSGTITPNVYYTAIFNNTDDRFELTHNTKLIDNSIVDTLHRHTELVASDGSPDPALGVDADGKVSLVLGTGINEFSTDTTLSGNSDDAVPTEKAVKTYISTHTSNTDAHHAESHTVASHSDTTASGSELNTLTDNSIADTLHRHSELVAPDGSPDPVLSVDDSGKVSFPAGTGINEFSTDGTLAGDSDDAVPTEKAVKTYSDNIVLSGDSIIKAWINFNGTGTIAIRDSFNITSITDNGAGDYTITWDTDFANVNYAATGSVNTGSYVDVGISSGSSYLVGSVSIRTFDDTGTKQDVSIINIIAIGDQV